MCSQKAETREACLDSLLLCTSSRTLPGGTCEYKTASVVFEYYHVSPIEVFLSRLLVGAPRAKHQNQVNVTGVVYQCDLATTSERCEPIEFDNKGLLLEIWAIFSCCDGWAGGGVSWSFVHYEMNCMNCPVFH